MFLIEKKNIHSRIGLITLNTNEWIKKIYLRTFNIII